MKRIGIVTALKREIKYLLGDLKEGKPLGEGASFHHPVYEGEIGGRDTVVVVSGVGKRGSMRAVRLLIESYDPDTIITAGYAGSLTPDLVVGDVVLVTRAVSGSGEGVDFVELEPAVSSDFGRKGTILTVDRFIGSVKEKRELGERLGAHIVDMESLYIGRIAEERGLPCIGIRVVSDDLGMEIPNLSGLLNREGEVETARAMRFFMSHPRRITPLLIFLYNIRRATLILDRYIRKSLPLL